MPFLLINGYGNAFAAKKLKSSTRYPHLKWVWVSWYAIAKAIYKEMGHLLYMYWEYFITSISKSQRYSVRFLVNHYNTGTAKPVKAENMRFTHPRFAVITNMIRFRLVFHMIAHHLLKKLVSQWKELGKK